MALLWGTVVVVASFVLNSYLYIILIYNIHTLNAFMLDKGLDSIIAAINSGDVATLASLTNAVMAIALLLWTIIVTWRWMLGDGGKQSTSNANGVVSISGHANQKDDNASGSFLLGFVVFICVVFNSYISLSPMLDMIIADKGFDSIIEAIYRRDVAMIALLKNAVAAIVLLLRTIWRGLMSCGGGKQGTSRHAYMSGYANKHTDAAPGSSSGRVSTFTVLCVGLAGGYIASNPFLVHRLALSSSVLQEKCSLALKEVASAHEKLSAAHEETEQCRLESDNMRSEWNGKLTAREATIHTYRQVTSDVDALRWELDTVLARLQDAFLQEISRKMKKDLKKVQPEIDRLRRIQDGLRKNLERENTARSEL